MDKVIEKIKNGGGFTIKYLKPHEFSVDVMKYIAENCSFADLMDSYKNIPKEITKAYHIFLINELEQIKKQQQILAEKERIRLIKYTKIDFSMSKSERDLYVKNLYNGIDIN